ncbi:DUF2505 family protein [Streptomyces sp. NPDC013171]|uniref:DUF2505 family protein n=1 Tax=Streptomyces sp. NPDC013171 TaxID=3364863 RepID=UPI00367ED665
MGKFTMVHSSHLPPERVWEQFLDRKFNEQFYQEALGWPQWSIEEQSDTGEEVVRKVAMTPRRELPGPIAKVLGTGFRQAEEGTFASTTRTGTWRRIPSTLADKWHEEATIRIESVDGGGCQMTIDVTLEMRVFGIGGLMESTFEKHLRNEWETFAQFSSQHP